MFIIISNNRGAYAFDSPPLKMIQVLSVLEFQVYN